MRAQLPLVLLLLSLVLGLAGRPVMTPPPLAPQAFASPINAACVQVTASVCKLHVDPFTLQIAPGQSLTAFQLRANGSPLYDFRTDVSNPPTSSYAPSLVRRDFAAHCGQTYTVNLLARDSGDSSFLNVGQAENITCPVGTYFQYLPLVNR